MDRFDEAGILIRPTVKLECNMDNEQLQIRLGEMAAEIERLAPYSEHWLYYQDFLSSNGFSGITDLLTKFHAQERENARLQSVIDDANAQGDADAAFESYLETFGGPDTNAWHDAPVDGVFKDGFNRGLLAAQQSPAVAVPEWFYAKDKLPDPDTEVWICVKNKNKQDGIWLHDICWHDGDKWGKREHTWEDIVLWAYPVDPFAMYTQSPRITEQDAPVIPTGWNISHNPKPIPDRRFDYDFWHDNYDGDANSLAGTAASYADAIAQIKEIELAKPDSAGG